MTQNQWKYLLPFFCISLLPWSTKAIAHGSKIDYREAKTIEIQATYDNNEPMANAQVVIYSPEDPAKPWSKGTTDEEGRFSFTPDTEQQGDWDIKVRQAGHGSIVSIPIDEEGITTSVTSNSWATGASDYTPLQKALLGVTSAWGFVGTALFFARRKTQ
ncbi:MAG: carboxypeptidase-like regulatory domain-containing protein [Spirulinaceae cyanobacterium]